MIENEFEHLEGSAVAKTTCKRDARLALGEVKDRVYVFLDGRLLGISGRSTNGEAVPVKVPAGTHRLDLLVENMSRINFGQRISEERKGLTESLSLGGKELGPWEQVGLPLQEPPNGTFEEIKEGKTFDNFTLYRGKFKIGSAFDTWLDMRGHGRGMVWLNGRNLGRYWKIGPSRSIFVPGCWMNAGQNQDNELVVLEMKTERPPTKVPTSAKAIWGN